MKKVIYRCLVLIIILISLGLIINSIYNIINTKHQVKKSIDNVEVILENRNENKNLIKEDNKKIKEGDIIGVLIFNKNNVKVPIIEGTTKESLEKGAGHLSISDIPPNKKECFLFGHRDTVFSYLKNIKESDKVTLKTINGEFKYKVNLTKITEINKNEILKKYGNDKLILVTCYPFNYIGNAPKRYIVICSLEK